MSPRWTSHLAPVIAVSTLLSWLVLAGTIANAKANGPEPLEARTEFFDENRDGTPFVWLLEDDYKAPDFFDHMDFFTGDDPTHGLVYYVDREAAFARNLAYIDDNKTVVMKADTDSTLNYGDWRASVRVSTKKIYTTGLFILDLNKAPWGCGVWPAWWSTSHTGWPVNGEIDIIEGVHDNEHNQVAWHTSPGCMLDPQESFTGNISIKGAGPAIDCDAAKNDNAGCSMTEWSRASYGPYFDEHGGGVFAMKWDENGIAVWSFYRAAVPSDIAAGSPNPKNWGPPSAVLGPGACDIEKHFRNHTIILNITFCGDWAGNSYETSGCPGTCHQRLMDPKNFVNATWSINSMRVYRKQPITAVIVNPSSATSTFTLDDWNSLAGVALPLVAGYALMA